MGFLKLSVVQRRKKYINSLYIMFQQIYKKLTTEMYACVEHSQL